MKSNRPASGLSAINIRGILLGLLVSAASFAWSHDAFAVDSTRTMPDNIATAATVTHYRTKAVDGVKIFYREAGPKDAIANLLDCRVGLSQLQTGWRDQARCGRRGRDDQSRYDIAATFN